MRVFLLTLTDYSVLKTWFCFRLHLKEQICSLCDPVVARTSLITLTYIVLSPPINWTD
jgi:hypothetical protein